MATSGLGLLGGPASLTRGCPASHVRMAHLHHPTASDGSGRNAQELLLKRGVLCIQKEAEPPICLPRIVNAPPTHHTRTNARTPPHRTAREVAQCDASDAVRRENVHRDRGGFAPPDPPSLVGGLRPPPLQSVQSSERAVARGRKKSCVCVCVNSISTNHALCIQRENNVQNLFSTLRQCKGSSQTECSNTQICPKTQSQYEKEKTTTTTTTLGPQGPSK